MHRCRDGAGELALVYESHQQAGGDSEPHARKVCEGSACTSLYLLPDVLVGLKCVTETRCKMHNISSSAKNKLTKAVSERNNLT